MAAAAVTDPAGIGGAQADAGEAGTTEGRLADLIEKGEVRLDDYLLSELDRTVIVKALRDRARWMAADIKSGEKGRKGRAK